MPQFLYVALPKQSFGSSTGQAERASAERRFEVGRLHDTVSLGIERWFQETHVLIYLFRVTLDEERLRTSESVQAIPVLCKNTYLNPAEYCPLMTHDLREQMSESYLTTIMQAWRTFHNHLHVTHKTMDHAQRLNNSHPSLILSQSIQSLERSLYLAVT